MTSPPPPPRSGFVATLVLRAKTFGHLFRVMATGAYWWLTPFLVILILFAVLLLVVEFVPGAAPFVYALF